MSFGLMSPSVLCRSRPYVIRVNVSFRFTSFVLMSHSDMCRSGLMSFGSLLFGLMSFMLCTVGVRKLLSGGAKRMKRCTVLYICLQNEYKTIWGKCRVRGNGKNAYAQCTNMQVYVENTFKKI